MTVPPNIKLLVVLSSAASRRPWLDLGTNGSEIDVNPIFRKLLSIESARDGTLSAGSCLALGSMPMMWARPEDEQHNASVHL
eukprot:4108968-Amphidinium_carterae.1